MSGRKKLLIVDDEEDLLAMLALRLEATGLFEIEKAHDGLQGLARAEEWKPDIILLDNIMPGMDGWEVCRRLRAERTCPGMAIVMMTAGTPQQSRQKALDLRADALILKPYDQTEVIATLKAVSTRQAQEA